MVGAHDMDARSVADEVVEVKRDAVVAYRTYNNDKLREREVEEALVRASHG